MDWTRVQSRLFFSPEADEVRQLPDLHGHDQRGGLSDLRRRKLRLHRRDHQHGGRRRGALGALFCSWILFKKPDPSFALNGTLAGLVAITAGCDVIPVHYAALTGLLAGILVVFACVFFDRIHVDDPVGAVSVHGICGAFGTLAMGLFAAEGGLFTGGLSLLSTQAIGVGTAFAWSFTVSLGIFLALKYSVGLRVSPEEEIEGLDVHEHDVYAYPPSFVTGVPDASERSPRPLEKPVPAVEVG